MKKWQCVVCGFIYDEAEGWPDEGIAPGTAIVLYDDSAVRTAARAWDWRGRSRSAR